MICVTIVTRDMKAVGFRDMPHSHRDMLAKASVMMTLNGRCFRVVEDVDPYEKQKCPAVA